MSNESIVCPCCGAEFGQLREFLDHRDTALALAIKTVSVVEDHSYLCGCLSCEVPRLFTNPPSTAYTDLVDGNNEYPSRPDLF